MNKLLFFITLFAAISCTTDVNNDDNLTNETDSLTVDNDLKDTLDKQIISDYDMSTVDKKNQTEFKQSLAKIERIHGEQWDFCTCVVKNDSINKAFAKPVSDKEFDRLSDRFDVIDSKCKAFLAQSPNVTPEERIAHEKKVKKCLKAAGIK